jgi:hypothetical protein
MKKIKQIETSKYVILLEENENRYIVRYKRNTMEQYTYVSFMDFNYANQVFDMTLIQLEGH